MRKPAAIAFLLRSALFLPLIFGAPVLEWGVNRIPLTNRWDQLAQNLLAAKPVWVDGDIRALKAACLRRLPPAKRWLVLGSSRALTISAGWFSGKNVWNAAVPTGGIDDSAALLEAYRESGRMPEGVILEFSPVLMRSLPLNQLLPLRQYRDRAVRRYGIDPRSGTLDRRDFYWDDALKDLRFHFDLMKNGPSTPAPGEVIAPDGSIVFGPSKAPSQPEVMDEVKEENSIVIAERVQSRPTGSALLFFRRFLDDLQSHGVQVVVFLPPVNPYAWDYYRTRGGYDESFIRTELNARHIPIVGGYSPYAARATPDDFYDNTHPRPALIHRLLEEGGVLDTAPNDRQDIVYKNE
jgi:hypothetical protein